MIAAASLQRGPQGPQAAPRAVLANLTYLAADSERPVSYTFEPPAGTPWRSGSFAARQVEIRDARPLAGALSLDGAGFALRRHRSAVADFYDDREVRAVYYPEIERLVREATGATRVLAFDHNCRSAPRAGRGEGGAKEPVKRVHNDFTAKSGIDRARAVLTAAGEDAEALLRQRFAAINAWRPIRGPVQESPLAVCDARSIAPQDLVAGDLVYRDRVGETYSVRFSPAHRWFYVPAMERNEVLLIKCFDSLEHGPARFAAHSAFDDPASPAGAPARESIEVRTFAFFGPDSPMEHR
jgi:hypothetical protein